MHGEGDGERGLVALESKEEGGVGEREVRIIFFPPLFWVSKELEGGGRGGWKWRREEEEGIILFLRTGKSGSRSDLVGGVGGWTVGNTMRGERNNQKQQPKKVGQELRNATTEEGKKKGTDCANKEETR